MPRSDGYVSADYLAKAALQAKAIKEQSYNLFEPLDGKIILDIGCGPGTDTIPLAARVGPNGRVYGLDIDEEMLANADMTARLEDVADRISHRTGSAESLPFEDAFFDGCRAERLFQVLPPSVNKNIVLSEMLRVTKPGGTIVLADTDWATASIDIDDIALERKMVHFFAHRMRPDGFAGRRLFRNLTSLGCTDLSCEVFGIAHTRLADTPFGVSLAQQAAAAGEITEDERDRWIGAVTKRDRDGTYYSSVSMILVSGRKPLPSDDSDI